MDIQEHISALQWEAIEAYPLECCGVLVETGDGTIDLRPSPAPLNDHRHFQVDPAVIVGTHQNGENILGFYHSHPDAPPILSQADLASMLVNDAPAWPNTEWLVISVYKGQNVEMVQYVWNPTIEAFEGKAVQEVVS